MMDVDDRREIRKRKYSLPYAAYFHRNEVTRGMHILLYECATVLRMQDNHSFFRKCEYVTFTFVIRMIHQSLKTISKLRYSSNWLTTHCLYNFSGFLYDNHVASFIPLRELSSFFYFLFLPSRVQGSCSNKSPFRLLQTILSSNFVPNGYRKIPFTSASLPLISFFFNLSG